MRRPVSLLLTLVLGSALTLATAPPSHAAGETFKVLSVTGTGCASGGFAMQVERANLDGGSYLVRTQVTTGGLSYMDEQASISVNGLSGWNLFDNHTYQPAANLGTWPLPENARLRIEFTLERPKGTVLYAWTTVVDGCNTGGVLYNGLAADDVDQDLVPAAVDACPAVFAAAANGCPTSTRALSLKYRARKERFQGTLACTGGSALCAGQRVQLWKTRPGPDRRFGRATTGADGTYKLKKVAKPGRYYATVDALLLPSVGQSAAVTSPKLKRR